MKMFKNLVGLTQQRLLLFVLLVEWLVFVFSGVSFSFLHGNPFFSLRVDPFLWLFFFAKLPQFIITHQWVGITIDVLIILLLIRLIINPDKNKTAIFLMLLSLLFYVTLMGYHTHRNFQTGFFLVLLPFVFNANKSKVLAFEACRYFLLFFYFSSAILKLANQSLVHTQGLSQHLAKQFVPYYVEGNTGLRTDVNSYLIGHVSLTHWLFLAAFVAELIMAVGFFTKRFDCWLGISLLCFHFANWFIMDIAPFGQIAFICLLFITNHFKEKTVVNDIA